MEIHIISECSEEQLAAIKKLMQDLPPEMTGEFLITYMTVMLSSFVKNPQDRLFLAQDLLRRTAFSVHIQENSNDPHR